MPLADRLIWLFIRGTRDLMSEAKVVTLGCRLNTYESEVMRKNAREAGLENAIIINTCAVTGEAVRQARQTIRKMRKSDPNAKIIVTGCAAQIDPEAFAEMEEVDRVIGNKEKLEVESFLPERTELIEVTDIMQVRETANHLIDGFDGHTRAFIEVQQGCDHRCTFCIIPFGRGPNRSVSIGEIVDRVKNLVERGYKEVVLTGVDVTSYGPDLPGKPTFGQMVRRVLSNVPELPRLRLSSLDPAAIDADLLEVIARESRLMPHFHLSLQSGEDMILKRMKRRHTIADAISLCDKIRMLRPMRCLGPILLRAFPPKRTRCLRQRWKRWIAAALLLPMSFLSARAKGRLRPVCHRCPVPSANNVPPEFVLLAMRRWMILWHRVLIKRFRCWLKKIMPDIANIIAPCS